ncbi:MAG: CARDB domain-containing protein, partial [Acidobacteriota bacterium]
PGTFEHWNVFLTDVDKAGTLGWIADGGLLSQIQARVSEARQAALAQDLPTVNARLDAAIALAEGATPAQMRREAHDLVVLNARYLKAHLPWPCEPKLVLDPPASFRSVGEAAVVTATLTNSATGTPIAGNSLTLEVIEGPHAGTKGEGTTDAQGRLSLTYAGARLGTDRITARTPFGTAPTPAGGASDRPGRGGGATPPPTGTAEACEAWDLISEPATVSWEGGPDLLVRFFVPPVLRSAPGNVFYITETTANEGNRTAGPSVTRYTLSASKPVDPQTALVVGERQVAPLGPGETSEVVEMPFTVPSGLPAGTYHLDACADATGVVAETNEGNNCASSRLSLAVGLMPENAPPDCTRAAASPARLWPPNHKLRGVTVGGVTDPDGDPVTLAVTAITQDEPTNGLAGG